MSEPHPFDGAQGLLAAVGNTPLVSLSHALRGAIPEGVEVYAKCEFLNPSGSVKARPALSMILDAERQGRLRPHQQPPMTILDASSGNTGIAYALVAAARGYRLVLCLPKNANPERRRLLAAYGAEVVFTSPLEGSDGAIRAARALSEEHPEWVYLDQYGNPANWRAHYGSTGPEIWQQSAQRVTHFVAALGTSGTFTGTARFLKEVNPSLKAVAVQPDSPFHGLEGLKHMETAIVPTIYAPELADIQLGAPTEASYAWVKRLATQGYLVGPSAGANVWAAVQVANLIGRGVIVTVFCDSGERYLSHGHLFEGGE